jgi:alpha-galactosidase
MNVLHRGIPARNRLALLVWLLVGPVLPVAAQQAVSIHNSRLAVSVRQDGTYEIRAQGLKEPVLEARVAAEIDHRWLRSSEYPRHRVNQSTFTDTLGPGHQLTVTHSGLSSAPDLVCILRLYDGHPYGDVEIVVRNTSGKAVTVQAIRGVEALGKPAINLGARDGADRVLSDSFSEDWPTLKIYDLGQAPKLMHRGAGSQLIYNRESKQSLFLGALRSERFLTILHLQAQKEASGEPRIASFTVDSTGTTEIQRDNALEGAPPEDLVELSLPVAAGEELHSEPVMFSAGDNYFAQLEAYGEAIRVLHHARVAGPNLIGWWSWTAFYGGIQEGPTLTNAHWLAEHLKPLGYEYFHIDEGYQYARGEYTTPNATQFPHGMRQIGREICHLGLKFGLWTAPFEVTGRAWIYEHHKDWLVHNAKGKPIRIGFVGRGSTDPLYALDTTHPGAQEYLRQAYRKLVREWGVRYFKLDFMDTTAIEGYRYKANTTVMQAQRLGLSIIREAVGEDVLLDKDGSPMLNPVGIVDEGRISVDTGHSFQASKEAAPGIAARYYMHRNWFVNDPDAFTVAGQVIPGHDWHQSKTPITLDDAEISVTLSAVSGGMFEEGDDLPKLGAEPERLALVKNADLLQMAKLGRAALPLDMLTYREEDELPSVFLLQEDRRQSMLAVFNWTDGPRSHAFALADLKLPAGDSYLATDVFHPDRAVGFEGGELALKDQPGHSVRLIKIINTWVPAAAPTITASVPQTAQVGNLLKFSATADRSGVPAISYHWDFGDGTTADGAEITHAYTLAGDYTVHLEVEGVDGLAAVSDCPVTVSGVLNAVFNLPQNSRYIEEGGPGPSLNVK